MGSVINYCSHNSKNSPNSKILLYQMQTQPALIDPVVRDFVRNEFGLRKRKERKPIVPKLDWLDEESSDDEKPLKIQILEEKKPIPSSYHITKRSEPIEITIQEKTVVGKHEEKKVEKKVEQKREIQVYNPFPTQKHSQKILKRFTQDSKSMPQSPKQMIVKNIGIHSLPLNRAEGVENLNKIQNNQDLLAISTREKEQKAAKDRELLKKIFKSDIHLKFEDLRYRYSASSEQHLGSLGNRIETIHGWVDNGLLSFVMINNMTHYSINV